LQCGLQVIRCGQAVGSEEIDDAGDFSLEVEDGRILAELSFSLIEEPDILQDLWGNLLFLLLGERQLVQLGADAGQEAVGMRGLVIR